MRWEDLFADLGAQLDAEAEHELGAEVAEIAAAEAARTDLPARLRARRGRWLVVGLAGGEVIEGEVADVGATWVLLSQRSRRALVPLGAVAWLDGVRGVAPEVTGVESRLGLGHALRAIAESEADVTVGVPGRSVVGMIALVGRDHLDVEVSADGVVLSVPFAALRSVVGG